MRTLLVYLPAFACLAMAAIICLPMLLKHGRHESDPEVAELKQEVARLKAQIAFRETEQVSSDG
jgi:hypothetical protein